jgi:chromosome segregation ATPase
MISIEERLNNMRMRLRFAHQEIEQLRAERDEWKQAAHVEGDDVGSLVAQIERLRAALKPFADAYTVLLEGGYDYLPPLDQRVDTDVYDELEMLHGDFYRAKEALDALST